MIKFFRKIRQNQFMENKTGKYFKYAIGEIVLVVIGILIALSINNWNNQRLANKQMNSFLQAIKEDLKSDGLEFDSSIKFNKEQAEQKKNILKLSNFDDLNIDSLFMVIRPRFSNYEINATTFDKVKSSGVTQISNNKELSENIYFYYTNRVIALKEFMDWDIQGSNLTANYFNYSSNLFELNIEGYNLDETDGIVNFQDESSRNKNLIKLLSEPTGRNHLKIEYTRKQRLADFLAVLKENTQGLIKDIEKELKK